MEQDRRAILERIALGNKVRMISGYTTSGNVTVSVCCNNTYTYSYGNYNRDGSSSTVLSATSDSTGYFEIMIDKDFVINNFTFCANQGASSNNTDSIMSLDLSKMGKTSTITNMIYAFAELKQLTQLTGLAILSSAKPTNFYRCFYQCNKLTTLDISSWNTSYVDCSTTSTEMDGFCMTFTQMTSLTTLKLPAIGSNMYIGNADNSWNSCFYQDSRLMNITCSGKISNNLGLEHTKVSVESIINIIDALDKSNVVSGKNTCTFNSNSWMGACGDEETRMLINAAKDAGWNLPDIVIVKYYESFRSTSSFVKSSAGYYSFGIEDDYSTTIGQVYAVVNEPASVAKYNHGYFTINFNKVVDISDGASVMKIKFTHFTEGLTRNGVSTTNNYYYKNIRLMDSDGNLTDWMVDDSSGTGGTIGNEYTYTYTLTSSKMSGIDATKFAGIVVSFIKMEDSAKARQKGGWFNDVLIS